jgi:hypothetical protein
MGSRLRACIAAILAGASLFPGLSCLAPAHSVLERDPGGRIVRRGRKELPIPHFQLCHKWAATESSQQSSVANSPGQTFSCRNVLILNGSSRPLAAHLALGL